MSLDYNYAMEKDKLQRKIEQIAEPHIQEVLGEMRKEYKERTNPESLGAHVGFGIMLFRFATVAAFLWLLIVFVGKILNWFNGLSGGFTKVDMITLVVTVLFGLIGIPAAYGYGRRKRK